MPKALGLFFFSITCDQCKKSLEPGSSSKIGDSNESALCNLPGTNIPALHRAWRLEDEITAAHQIHCLALLVAPNLLPRALRLRCFLEDKIEM